jgi:AcrR family transcriptional regulator
MPTKSGAVNRGPAAAGQNRAAILAAARRLFAERGYKVPLSAIASAAGVGQAVMYRHFPTRLDLAIAVFEENLIELETIASSHDPDAFLHLWSRLVELTIVESAFVEMVVDARRTLTAYDGHQRLRALIEGTLGRSQRAGLIDGSLTPDDVLLWWRMVFGVVITSTETGTADVTAAVEKALRLPAVVQPRH